MNGFPNPLATTPKIRGKPNRRTLNEVIDQITGNAASVTTLLGGGQHGYTAICMSTVRYNTLPNTVPFTSPLSPGVYVVDTSAKTSAAQREGKLHEYNSREYQFNMYQNAEQACKNMFIACVPSECYIKLKGRHTMFNGIALVYLFNT